MGRKIVAAVAAATVVAAIALAPKVTTTESRQDDPPVVPTTDSMFDWLPRGSLASDPDALAAAKAVIGTLAIEPSRLTVLYAGDTSAGRLVVGAIGHADRGEIVALSGPTGGAIAALTPLGPAGEGVEDRVVSRAWMDLSGESWLFILTDPTLRDLDVSWEPTYDADGVAHRKWQRVQHDHGVLFTGTPTVAMTARIRMTHASAEVVDRPVIEDSDNLNDPGFLPLPNAPDAPLPPGTDLRGADPHTVAWGLAQAKIATMVSPAPVTVRWSLGSQVLMTVKTEGGGALSVYADTTDPDAPYLDIVPVAQAEADRAIMLRYTENGTRVFAPHAIGSRVAPFSVTVAETGFADLPVATDEVDLGQAGRVDPRAENRADPFDLR
ncbi:hypothetical protein [Alloactinosynnema sp. L-07]|uniref:hypothetical protein n=1 Tax=Alloactinosynnema sp. L-07 TaxID=1653480 RepID=UPI00065EF70B|nr:hypothetical protein [Alloactinosynnema sp. L-07]CRK59627.1 hypothetical protein [Alloactinosynnema sp. L-07]